FYTSALLDEPGRLDELLAKSGDLIAFQPARVDDDKAVVRGQVQLPEGQDVPVMFRMHHRGEEWMVYDVTVEGVSLVTNYRNSFSQEIKQAGLERLIERLEERNNEILQRAREGNADGSVDAVAG
ncbi:MAG TPA: ABC transporter substrate-binding protein, partial [Gammaproteobacteria bacterium]|nr:ABC transporter substrate-binding protein [Gammaproteobacteria bacterium]